MSNRSLKSRAVTIAEDFDSNYRIQQGTGCWIWQRAIAAKGYGHFMLKGKLVYSHRFSWQRANGDIPEGFHVLHECDTPACVNPDHLFLGSNLDNILDKRRKQAECLEKYVVRLLQQQRGGWEPALARISALLQQSSKDISQSDSQDKRLTA